MRSGTAYAIRIGVKRGWTEFLHSLRQVADLAFYVVIGVGAFTYLTLNRDTVIEGTSLTLPAVVLPSLVAGLIVFGGMVSAGQALAVEREDGTLLRAKALPHGMTAYITGHVTRTTVEAIPSLAVVVVPSVLLLDGVMSTGAAGWLHALILLVLGLVTAVPLGMIIGALVPDPRRFTVWGILPILVIASVSGIFSPITALPGWVQAIAQVFPLYWLGLGMRSAFLPDAAAVAEIGESWRQVETFGVLGLWAVAGLLLAPVVLRRMARRESGANLEVRRQRALQRI